MNQTPPKLIFLVVIAIATITGFGVLSLCLSMFFKTWSDPATLTAVIAITTGGLGSLTTILANPRTQPPATESTTTTTTTQAPPPPTPPKEPAKVEIVQPPENPIPVTETPPVV